MTRRDPSRGRRRGDEHLNQSVEKKTRSASVHSHSDGTNMEGPPKAKAAVTQRERRMTSGPPDYTKRPMILGLRITNPDLRQQIGMVLQRDMDVVT